MRAENGVALREWAVLCDRLGSGDQILLLRAGGIHERAFRGPRHAGTASIEHRELWLLPTYLHEAASRLVPAARERFDELTAVPVPDGRGRIDLHASVSDAVFVDDRARLPGLEPFHVYDPGYVRDRFEFREPGLWAIVLRVFRRDVPHEVELRPEHAGCVSWVHFDPPLSTSGLRPVLEADAFETARRRVLDALGAA